ncbi:hypothetical protein ACLOJK_036542 [Asimina triloba]
MGCLGSNHGYQWVAGFAHEDEDRGDGANRLKTLMGSETHYLKEMLTKPLIVAWVCYFGRDSCCLQIDAVVPASGRNAGPLLPGCYDQSGRGRCLNGRPCRWVLIWASWSLEARSMPLGWATAEMGTRDLELGHRSGFRGAPAVGDLSWIGQIGFLPCAIMAAD